MYGDVNTYLLSCKHLLIVYLYPQSRQETRPSVPMNGDVNTYLYKHLLIVM